MCIAFASLSMSNVYASFCKQTERTEVSGGGTAEATLADSASGLAGIQRPHSCSPCVASGDGDWQWVATAWQSLRRMEVGNGT